MEILGKSKKSNRMTRTLYLPLKPEEALLCASNCNSSFVTMMVRKKLLPMSSPSIKTNQRIEHLGLSLAESQQLLGTLQHHLLQQQVNTFLDTHATCPDCATP